MTASAVQARAAVVRSKGGPFLIEDVRLEMPRDDEVLIRVVATGLCHTDLVIRDQLFPLRAPVVLGHEASGVVEAIGKRVTKVAVGDHVVLTFNSCSECRPCLTGLPAACENFNGFNFSGARPDGSHAVRSAEGSDPQDRFFGQSSFASHAIAHERNTVRVRKDAPLELLGPLGCGVQTGAGVVINTLKLGAGASFAAFGGGTVGLSAVMAAQVAGATTIFCVDVVSERLDLAKALGATHVIDGRHEDPVQAIRAVTGLGVDFALESTSLPELAGQVVAALRPRGCGVLVAPSKPGTKLAIDMGDLIRNGKIVRGVIEGDSVPDVFIPHLIDLFMQGRFPFDRLITHYALEDINLAAKESISGRTVKPLIRFDGWTDGRPRQETTPTD